MLPAAPASPRPRAASRCAAHAVVVDLPLVPVTTMRRVSRSKRAANSSSASTGTPAARAAATGAASGGTPGDTTTAVARAIRARS
jgi:hypothetical protein